MLNLTMYTTDGCHLCEYAETVLEDVVLTEPELTWKKVDIASQDDLIERYGIRIPVIRLEGADYDVGWPFSADDVLHYLAQFKTLAHPT
ncbi:glutaredoxin family protein [Saccharospirillum impatiens]|uniref:glutaredoxin family protein n=1 Tax=Saccharospirillum impatiens TaxID=169438 RepID=UPI0004042840|nr:glutaredoxin family protein [Saccharospirillum impatiens]